jgi:DNA (cytosine-5)-methyltransferase 1
MILRELSLFTGYSGISLGVKLANIDTKVVAYVEWEKYPQEIIKARIKDGFLDDAPIFSDISSFRGEQFRGVVDLITAGFPCQPHSVAGARQSSGDARNKWPDTLRVIREVAPRYVLLENVPGLLSSSVDERTPAYGGVVVGELASLGYSVHWRTIGADDVGAPHRRKRWWCIAVADSRQQPTGIEGRGPNGGREDASPETGVGATEGHGLADGNNPLGDSDITGLQGWQQSLGGSTYELPPWPPSPSDTDGWERVLRERPDLAPALHKEIESEFRGVDDGRSHRVDELKALGNGVVPAVVAQFLRRLRGVRSE